MVLDELDVRVSAARCVLLVQLPSGALCLCGGRFVGWCSRSLTLLTLLPTNIASGSGEARIISILNFKRELESLYLNLQRITLKVMKGQGAQSRFRLRIIYYVGGCHRERNRRSGGVPTVDRTIEGGQGFVRASDAEERFAETAMKGRIQRCQL